MTALAGELQVFAGRFQKMSKVPGATREELRAEIEREGVVTPIVVAPDGEIIDGHTRWEIAGELGIQDTVPVEVHPFTSDSEKEAAAVILNVVRREPNKDDQARWRAIRDARIVELRRAGMTQQQVAEQVGISQKHVSRIVERSQLDIRSESQRPAELPPGKARTPEASATRQEQVVALAEAGAKRTEIAKTLGLSPSAVSRRLAIHREQQPPTEPPTDADVVERIRAMAGNGHTRQQIAAALGIPFPSVTRRCRKHGIDVPGERARGGRTTRSTVDVSAAMGRWLDNLTAVIDSVDSWLDLDQLDPERAGEWSRSLDQATQRLRAHNRHIKSLIPKEQDQP